MQTQTSQRITEIAGPASRAPKATAFVPFAEAPVNRRPVRVAFPARRRVTCLTRRALLAALREAEFAAWMNSGGDYLDSRHNPLAK